MSGHVEITLNEKDYEWWLIGLREDGVSTGELQADVPTEPTMTAITIVRDDEEEAQ